MRKLLVLTVLIALAGTSSPAFADPPGGPKPHKFGAHTLFGTIASISGNNLVLQKRNGKQIVVDISDAVLSDQLGVMYIGRPVALHGEYIAKHLYHVYAITSANGIRFGSDPPDQ